MPQVVKLNVVQTSHLQALVSAIANDADFKQSPVDMVS